MLPILWSRLGEADDPTSVTCGEDGPKIGPIPLLKRTRSGFEPRPAAELDFVFGQALNHPTQFADKTRGLTAIADALEKRDVARAMLITQFMWLPTLPDQRALGKAVKADALIKAGFNPAEASDGQGRWTNETSADGNLTNPPNPNLHQAGLFFPDTVIPWLETVKPVEPLAPTPPFPGEILPPAVGTPDTVQPRSPQNPYPKDEGCEEGWGKAIEYCGKLAIDGKLGHGDYREHGKYFEQCIRGQVSERCGGNAI